MDKNIILFIVMIFLVGFLVGYFVYDVQHNKINVNKNQNGTFNIPDIEYTKQFCKDKGYDWGCIDTNSKCKTDIECFQSYGDTLKVTCFGIA